MCEEICHEQDKNGPCPHGAHINPPCAKMQSHSWLATSSICLKDHTDSQWP